MFNTIIMKKGYASLTNREYEGFEKGDTIWGSCSEPEELGRWNISEKTKAEKELAKYKCSYTQRSGGTNEIEEYALEYCECDDDGEFLSGSDYNLAEEA